MDVLNSLRSEFDVINEKLDFVVISIKEGSVDQSQLDKYVKIDKQRDEIDYNGE